MINLDYLSRLQSVIPGGAHTYSRGSDQFPSNAPQILSHGLGAYSFDPDGNQYVDYAMGCRSVTLGFANERINNAAIAQINNGNSLTRPSLIELEAAELIVDLIPSAEMVKFAKNGSNVTTAALKLARSYTSRPFICIPRQHPFFSFDDWFIGTTPPSRGIPHSHHTHTLLFDYNDIDSLRSLFSQYPGQIAAVMLEPSTDITPCSDSCKELTSDNPCLKCPSTSQNFLHLVSQLCKKEGALFILDEMITGFRWHLKGAQHYFGVDPDLSTFGKGMANGFSLAALVGRKEIMSLGGISPEGSERTFLLSTTHGAELSSLGAFVETVSFYKDFNVCDHLWSFGDRLRYELNSLSEELGLKEYFSVYGPSIALSFKTLDSKLIPSLEFRTLFAQEMVSSGVLFPCIAQSFSHGEQELDITLSAARKSLTTYAKALSDGVDHFLEGSPIKPVFRKFN